MHFIFLQLVDPNSDLISSSIVTTFADGSNTATATAVIRNDAIPETNETFTLTISGLSPEAAQIGSPSSMQLIIRANDQPFGLFQFRPVSDFFQWNLSQGHSKQKT